MEGGGLGFGGAAHRCSAEGTARAPCGGDPPKQSASGQCCGRRDLSTSPASPSCSYRASHPCSVCRLTLHCAAISVTVRPSPITARTAWYLCSATLISLMRGSVKHHPKYV